MKSRMPKQPGHAGAPASSFKGGEVKGISEHLVRNYCPSLDKPDFSVLSRRAPDSWMLRNQIDTPAGWFRRGHSSQPPLCLHPAQSPGFSRPLTCHRLLDFLHLKLLGSPSPTFVSAHPSGSCSESIRTGGGELLFLPLNLEVCLRLHLAPSFSRQSGDVCPWGRPIVWWGGLWSLVLLVPIASGDGGCLDSHPLLMSQPALTCALVFLTRENTLGPHPLVPPGPLFPPQLSISPALSWFPYLPLTSHPTPLRLLPP